jgi:hypothetical protein
MKLLKLIFIFSISKDQMALFQQRLENLIDRMEERRNWWVEASNLSYFLFFLMGLSKQRLQNLIDGIGERRDW